MTVKIDIAALAKLARLEVSDEELKKLEKEIPEILAFVDKLKEVNVDGVEPTSHPLALKNVFREDTVAPSLAIEEFLKKSPKAHGRFFEVPKIIEDNS